MALRIRGTEALLVAVVMLYSWCYVADFQLRLSQWQYSDNPITFACAAKFPELFDNDFVANNQLSVWRRFALGASMQNWIPTLLYTRWDIDPYPVTRCLTFLQGAAIGLGIFIFVNVVTRNSLFSLIATVFCYLSNPWGLNLANYGFDSSWTFMPYPAHAALGAVVVALALMMTEKYWCWAFVFALYAGLMHPTMGPYCFAVMGSYYLAKRCFCQVSSWRLAMVLFTLALFAIPVVLAGSGSQGTPVARDELFAGLMLNRHHVPWTGEARFQHAWPAVIIWMTLCFLGWKRCDQLTKNYRFLWFSALFTAVLLSLSHVAGFLFRIPFLLGITGLRSITLLSLVSLPVVVVYMIENLRSGSTVRRICAILFFTLPFLGEEYVLIGYVTLSLLLMEFGDGQVGPWKIAVSQKAQRACHVLAMLILVLWMISFIALARIDMEHPGLLFQTHSILTWHALAAMGEAANPPWMLCLLVVVFCLVLCGLLGLGQGRWSHWLSPFHSRSELSQRVLWILVLGYCGCFLANAWLDRAAPLSVGSPVLQAQRWAQAHGLLQTVRRGFQGSPVLEAQQWARKHTPPDSLFLTTWRNAWIATARRRHFYPITFEFYSYKGFEENKARRDRLLEFYGIQPEFAALHRGPGLRQLQRQMLRGFGEEQWLRFADEFAVTHLVTIKNRFYRTRPLTFPVVFQNESVRIYELKRNQQVKLQ